MREIRTPNGEVYARVELDDRQLRIQLSYYPTLWFTMDSRVVPQLAALLREAEFFKCL